MKENTFTHPVTDAQYKEVEDENGIKSSTRYMPGYEPCEVTVGEGESAHPCGVHPSLSFNSKFPKEIKVITCEHVTQKPDIYV